MKLLIDVSAGRAIGETLAAMGHDVAGVWDRDPRMPDTDVLAWAVADQ
jgi:Domain of unknown function (DUF5615)